MGLVLRMDGSVERFTWLLGQNNLFDTWQNLVPDMHFASMHLEEMGVYLLYDDEGKLRSDWRERINPVATILFGNNFGVSLCEPDVQISGDAILIGPEVWRDGKSMGLSKGAVSLIEMLSQQFQQHRAKAKGV
jgi:hypothetical protein